MATRASSRLRIPAPGTTSTSASTPPTTPFLFADLPVGEPLSYADMEHITGDPGTMRKIGNRKHELWYQTPAMLKCPLCRKHPHRSSLINRLKVAEAGGFFHLQACSACQYSSVRCMGSTRISGSYVAFVDWDTVVFVDQKTKEVVVSGDQDDTGDNNASSGSNVTLEEGDHETGLAEENERAHTDAVGDEHSPDHVMDTHPGDDAHDDHHRPSKRARVKTQVSPSPAPLPRTPSPQPPGAITSTGPLSADIAGLLKPIADRLKGHDEEKAQWAIEQAQWSDERARLHSQLTASQSDMDVLRAEFAAREAVCAQREEAWALEKVQHAAAEASWRAEKEEFEVWRQDCLRFLQR
ncbi:uncharacterized protein LOC62_05G006788 [Vanrija pseudolonga]|uniref:Uncharacterized protein n=1 Tax=Vanrija pseudolonga TaxID=143232 RepID=A0AAF1BJC1_9TREE|nr:hypothetical protein LOC62_05G006788 [Vanrija pseudolonga]